MPEMKAARAAGVPVERTQQFHANNSWLEIRIQPAEREIVVYLRDVTARKRAELRLRESEQRLQLLLGQVPAVVWTVDLDMRFESLMGAGLSAQGLEENELLGKRFEAMDWHVQHVDWRTDDGYHEDVGALYGAIEAAKAETSRPSFINLRTIIGWPAPTKQNTGKAHGSALGADEVAATKEVLGFDPGVDFPVEDEALAHARQVTERIYPLHAAPAPHAPNP